MKYCFITTALAVFMTMPGAIAQIPDHDVASNGEKTLFEEVTEIKSKTDKFHLYLNMNGALVTKWRGSEFDEGAFRMNQLRIEMTGQVNDWLTYRYRQRLNKGDNPAGYRDNILQSIDYAGFGINLGKFSMFLGKQCAAFGGVDFDRNPIEVFGNPWLVDYMTNFMTGVKFTYNLTPRQQLQFQVLNSLVGSSEEMYGDYEKSKMPMVYTLNWNGNFNDFYKTRWSASYMTETRHHSLTYFAMGNEFIFSPTVWAYVDLMYSRQGVDRLGQVTKMVAPADHKYNTTKVDYMSGLCYVNWRFKPAWSVFGKVICDTGGIYGSHDGLAKGRYCTSWGYIGGVEFYPFKDRTLHFYAAYQGRSYDYTKTAQSFGNRNYFTHDLSVGFIWQMPLF